MRSAATLRGSRAILATVAVAVAFACEAVAPAIARDPQWRVTFEVYSVGGMFVGPDRGGATEIAATVVLSEPGGRTLKIAVGSHPRVVMLPAGRYHSYAKYPRGPLKCHAKNGTFIPRSGLSVKYICQVP